MVSALVFINGEMMTKEVFTKPSLFLSIHSSESQQEFFKMLDEKIEKVIEVASLLLLLKGWEALSSP